MLPITLEPQQQTSLFTKHSYNASNFELEVVKNGPTTEIRLHVPPAVKKEKVVRRTRKKSIPKYETIFLFQ